MRNACIIALCLYATIVLGQKHKTSKNFSLLRASLEHSPEADANKDGVLTEEEYRNYQFIGVRRKRYKPFAGYYHVLKDIPYVAGGCESQKLDIIIPENKKEGLLPAVVFIHGGGWKKGDKIDGYPMMDDFLKDGNYVGVSINYRLTNEASWPTQIHDCKAAIRWLKANAESYGIDKSKLGLWGTSAGGHLVVLMALTGDNKDMEGNVGQHLSESTSVACAINGFGPSDLMLKGTLVHKITHNDFTDSQYNAFNLLGVEEIKAKAKHASPIYWVHKDAPPLLIYHGIQDDMVDIEHSDKLFRMMNAANTKDTYLIRIENMKHGHGGPKFSEIAQRMLDFLDKYLGGKDINIQKKITIRQPDKS